MTAAEGPAVPFVVSRAFTSVPAVGQRAVGLASTSGRFLAAPAPLSSSARLILEQSLHLVGTRDLRRVNRSVPDDCSGFVRVAYLKAGIDLVSEGFLNGENAVSAIFRRAERAGALHRRRPRPGDLVFFRETYDRNRDGRRNDGMTHIGVVEEVGAEGTITFIHRGSKGVARARMNLHQPTAHQLRPGGPVLNDFLRPAAKGHRSYLAGELFAGFAASEAL